MSLSLVRVILAAGGLCLAMSAGGCGLGWGTIDPNAVAGARLALSRPPPALEEDAEWTSSEAAKPSGGSVLLGELLAIFPGLFVHGVGHYYAGDYRTARRLSHVGQFGYLMTAIGGGVFAGGYFLDQEDDLTGFAYTLYGVGGTVGAVGIFYFFTAWFYDMIDTPRAVRSGGQPPPRTTFVDSLDLFE